MKATSTTSAPAAIGPYSQAIVTGNLVFVSGQLPIDPATGSFAQGGIKELTRQSLTNMAHILKEAGTDMAHVVKTTVFLADMDDFAGMNESPDYTKTKLYKTVGLRLVETVINQNFK